MLARNVLWGATCGLGLGAFYALLGVGIYLLRDSPEIGGLSAGGMLLLYLGAGCVGGVVVGLFRPLLVHRAFASLVGILALLPMTFGSIIMVYGPPSSLDRVDYLSAIIAAIILGGVGGYKFWELQFDDAEDL